jgi:hypothetical protein
MVGRGGAASVERTAPVIGALPVMRPAFLVFWPVGRYVEFHGPQRLLAEHVLGLRCARLTRGDYALTAGFPRRLAERFARTALARGYDVVLVARRCGASGEPARPRSVLLSPAASFRC